MPEQTSSMFYKIGKFIAREPAVSLILFVTVVLTVAMFNYLSTPAKPPAAKAETVAPATEAALKNAATEKGKICESEMTALIATATQQLTKKQYGDAYTTLSKCEGFYPTGSDGEKLHKKASDLKIAELEKESAAIAKREKIKKKKEGVRIGMSQQDVLDSSWGKPTKINTTTRASGVREQWVYGSGNYLYFENGTLTSIQN
jgi:hypothetical protein